MPATFNDHRGIPCPKGDVIDVLAHERRTGRCHYILADLGSVPTPDDALSLCWEHVVS